MTTKEIGIVDWSTADVDRAARREMALCLPSSQEWREMIENSVCFLEKEWASGAEIYGVTTGYGDSASVRVPAELVRDLPENLYEFHGCGLGSHFCEEEARAILLVRLISIAKGPSGVRLELLEQMLTLFNAGVVPLIPEEGSVGASGDLTPLSYIAALVCGKRKALYESRETEAERVLELFGLAPLELKPKEALALMNGTSAMTGVAVLAYHRAEYLCRLSARITAMIVEALGANRSHFDPRLFALKPHPGQAQVAAWIASDLRAEKPLYGSGAIQDCYSLRCAAHVIGVLADALPWIKRSLEIELNSANDNPLLSLEDGEILHGGNFYGGHVAFAMDSMKTAVANLADLFDRQLGLLVDARTNNGLARGLSGAASERSTINHGFKAVQIGTSAWAAEALKQCMPASVFSRSTECHNQDKVSMGTISARDCRRVLELCEQVLASALLAATQAIYLREQSGEIQIGALAPALRNTYLEVRERFSPLEEDRPLEEELRLMLASIRNRSFHLYDE